MASLAPAVAAAPGGGAFTPASTVADLSAGPLLHRIANLTCEQCRTLCRNKLENCLIRAGASRGDQARCRRLHSGSYYSCMNQCDREYCRGR
jgi:hypothetical protein